MLGVVTVPDGAKGHTIVVVVNGQKSSLFAA